MSSSLVKENLSCYSYFFQRHHLRCVKKRACADLAQALYGGYRFNNVFLFTIKTILLDCKDITRFKSVAVVKEQSHVVGTRCRKTGIIGHGAIRNTI